MTMQSSKILVRNNFIIHQVKYCKSLIALCPPIELNFFIFRWSHAFSRRTLIKQCLLPASFKAQIMPVMAAKVQIISAKDCWLPLQTPPM